MRKLILLFCALLSIEKISAGCAMGSIYTSNGLCSFYDIYHLPTVLQIKSDTTFQLTIRGNFSCLYKIRNVTITYNGDTVFKQLAEVFGLSVKISEKPGVYRISCYHSYRPGNWVTTFTLVPPPLKLEIQSNEMMADSASTGIAELSPIEILQVYPIPAHKILKIVSETEEIHQISVTDLQGKVITFIEPNSHHVKLPLDNIPSGWYLLKVATLSNKVTVRRIPVL